MRSGLPGQAPSQHGRPLLVVRGGQTGVPGLVHGTWLAIGCYTKEKSQNPDLDIGPGCHGFLP